MSPDDMRATLMAALRYVDAWKWKETQEMLDRNRKHEKRSYEDEEK